MLAGMSTKYEIDPSALEDPHFDTAAHPQWAAIQRFLSEAAASGEVVELSTRLETMSPAQAADRLNLSRSTISRRIARGEIHTIRVGNRHKITEREFERFRRSLMQEMADPYADDIETDLLA